MHLYLPPYTFVKNYLNFIPLFIIMFFSMGLFIIYYRSAEDAPKYGSPTPLTHNHLILNISSWQFYLSVDLAHESNSRVFKSPFRYSAQVSCNFSRTKARHL